MSEKIYIRIHEASGDITIHSKPPRPHTDGLKEVKAYNRDCEEITRFEDSNGRSRFSWIETTLHE